MLCDGKERRPLITAKFELFRKRNGKFIFRFVAPDGEIIYQGQEYKELEGALEAVEFIKKSAGWVAFNILDSEVKSTQFKVPNSSKITNSEGVQKEILNKELDRVNKVLSELLLKNSELEHQRSKEIVKELAVMFLDLTGFSTMKESDRQTKVEMLRVVASMLLSNAGGMYVNTWGDAIVAGFEEMNEGLVCACKFIQHLAIENITARIGMSFGKAIVNYNPLTDKMDINGDSINVGARLETMAEVNEVLISKELYDHHDINRDKYNFKLHMRPLKKSVGNLPAGTLVECYGVKLKN